MHDTTGDVNYFRDSRNCARRDTALTLDMEQPDGTVATVELPTMWVVCPVCRGKGTHVNPSIDCDGLSAEDFADDPDFAEDYFAGTYDQTCNCCNGRTTVREVDHERLTAEQRKALDARVRDERAMYYEQMAEIRMGC
jgi:hypothetical protein